MKFRALRLNEGNFNWASEGIAKKTKIVDVVYNASNNELVRTKTLVKNCVITIDATPFKQWYLKHYNLELGNKKAKTEDPKNQKKSKHLTAKLQQRIKDRVIDPKVAFYIQGRGTVLLRQTPRLRFEQARPVRTL